MEAIAHLQFGDNDSGMYNKSYPIVRCHTHLSKGFSSHNVTSDAYCECIEVTVVAPTNRDLELQDWFLSGTPRTGRISYSLTDVNGVGGNIKDRTIMFEDAQCFKLSEDYDIANNNLRLLTVAFVPKVCQVDQNKYILQ